MIISRFAILVSLLFGPVAAHAQVVANPTTQAQFCVDRTVTPWVIGHARKDGKCVGVETQDPVTGAVTSTAPALISPTQNLSFAPIGNIANTLGSLVVQGPSKSTTTREFMTAFGIRVISGTAALNTSGTADKVALYVAADCISSGGGACWAGNHLVSIEPGWSASGAYGATADEFDVDNNDINVGEADGIAGFNSSPGVVGFTVTGAGTARSTAAMVVSGPGNRTIFNRGLVITNNSVQQCSLCDYGIAGTSIDIRGTHNIGVDLSKGTFNSSLLLANNQTINAVGPGGAGGAQLISLGTNNHVQIAPSGSTGVDVTPPIVSGTSSLTPQIDTSATGFIATPGTKASLTVATSGMIVFNDNANGDVAAFIFGGGQTILLGSTLGNFVATSAPAAGKIGFYYDSGLARYTIISARGSAETLTAINMRNGAFN